MDLLFQLGNTFAFICWIVLLIFPQRANVLRILQYGSVSIFAIAYLVLIAPLIVDFQSDSFSELGNVKQLFQTDQMVVAGWFHYLAFDLFVGIYIVKKGIQLNWKRWHYSICLPFTFMFGPVGLLMFHLIKLIKK